MKRYLTFLIGIVLLATATAQAGTVRVTLLTPRKMLRATGPPTIYRVEFPGVAGTGQLEVVNGDTTSGSRVSSARIELNGSNILNPNDLSQDVASVSREVTVNASNVIVVQVESIPGAFLMLSVSQNLEADAAAVVGADGAEMEVTDAASALHGLKLTIPAGAIEVPTVITVTHDPSLFLATDPHKETTLALPGFRIFPDTRLAHPATLSVPYPDSDLDGVIDGSDLPADSLQLYFTGAGDSEAYRAESVVDSAHGRVITRTDHFSLWLPFAHRWTAGTVSYRVDNLPVPFNTPDTFSDDISNAALQWSAAIDGTVAFERNDSILSPNFTVRARDFRSLWFYGGREATTPALVTRLVKTEWFATAPLSVNFNTALLWGSGYASWPPPESGPLYPLPFLRIALHEFGHVTGLPEYGGVCIADADTDKPVMWYECPTAAQPNGYFPLTTLANFDVNSVRMLYGLPARAGDLCAWAQVADMPTARLANTAGIGVVRGKITVIGDHDGNPGSGTVNEEYDPTSNTWQTKRAYPRSEGRRGLNSDAVVGDRIFLFGGSNIWNNYHVQTVDAYNPVTDTWNLDVAAYPVRVDGVATTTLNDQVYAFGGHDYNAPAYRLAYRFDPGSRSFTRLADMPRGRLFAKTFVKGGDIWVAGGWDYGIPPIPSVDIYKPATNQWQTGPALPRTDQAPSWVGMADQRVYAIYSEFGVGKPIVYRYRETSSDWEQVCESSVLQYSFGAAVVGNSVYTIGGGDPKLRTVQRFTATR